MDVVLTVCVFSAMVVGPSKSMAFWAPVESTQFSPRITEGLMDFIFDKLNWLCNHRKLRAFHVVFLPLLMVLLHNYVWAVIIMAVITFVFNFFVTTQLMLDVFGRDQDIETYREALSYAHAVVAKSEALIEEKELAEEDRKLLLIGLALAKIVSDKALTDPAEAEKYLTVLREMRQSGQVPTGVP